MFKHILLATTLVAAATNVSFAMSDADCTTLANRSDVYAGGKLTDRYAQAAVKAGRTIPADGMINQAGFMEACKADAFKTAAMMPEPGAPLAGANSRDLHRIAPVL